MVHLIYNEEGNPIGWEMRPITKEEHALIAEIRDLQFFGFEDSRIEYDGISFIDPSKGKVLGNIASLSWKQKKYKED